MEARDNLIAHGPRPSVLEVYDCDAPTLPVAAKNWSAGSFKRR